MYHFTRCTRSNHVLLIRVLLTLCAAWSITGVAQDNAAKIPLVTFAAGAIQLGNKTVAVEIASTPEQRMIGLMGRTSLPQDSGMLFVFDEVASPCFWMFNTPLPLSVGFFDEYGELVNFDDMQPFDESHHCARKPIKYALEMTQGWFVESAISEGMHMTVKP
jgi:uncharacterized protein